MTEEASPSGWVEATDPNSGNTYYFNSITGASQWDRPEELLNAGKGNGGIAADEDATGAGVIDVAAAESSGDVIQEQEQEQLVSEDEASVHTEPSANTEESAAYDDANARHLSDAARNLSFESLPGGWIEAVDQASGKVYYYNQETGMSSWERPMTDITAESGVTTYSADVTVKKEDEQVAMGFDEDVVDETAEEMANVDLDEPTKETPNLVDDLAQDASASSYIQPEEESFTSAIQEGEEEDIIADTSQSFELPIGWTEAVDPTSGRTYYCNSITGESSWEKPTLIVRDESLFQVPAVAGAVGAAAAEEEEVVEPTTEEESSIPVESEGLDDATVEESFEDANEVLEQAADDSVKLSDGYALPSLNGPFLKGPPFVNGVAPTEAATQFQLDESIISQDKPSSAQTEEEPIIANEEEEEDIIDSQSLLPMGWTEAVDPTSGKTYYCNTDTGESSWERPMVMDEPPIVEETAADAQAAEEEEEEVVDVTKDDEGVVLFPTEEELVPSEPEFVVHKSFETAVSRPNTEFFEANNEAAIVGAVTEEPIPLASDPDEVVTNVNESVKESIEVNGLTEQPKQHEEKSPASINNNKHTLDKKLIEPYNYINAVPGKDVRGKLIDCFQLWFNVPPNPDILTEIKSIIGDLHNASLLIDDIEDNSKLRRGVPVAHSIFGVAPVINTANYVYFLALERCHGLGNEKAMKVFVSEMLNLHRGQGYDIQWRDTTTCPTEEQYISMVTDKTGGLFRLAVGLLQSFATTCKDVDFVPLVNNLGLYFQIRDDLINLADEEYFKSKSFCEDLTEGKFSYPIIHCIRSGGEEGSSAAVQLLSILKQRTEDVDVKRYAQRLMFDSGSLRYTREKCTELKKDIVKQIEELGGNMGLLKIIDMLDVQVEKIAELDGDNFDESFKNVKTPMGMKTKKQQTSEANKDGAGTLPTMNLDYT